MKVVLLRAVLAVVWLGFTAQAAETTPSTEQRLSRLEALVAALPSSEALQTCTEDAERQRTELRQLQRTVQQLQGQLEQLAAPEPQQKPAQQDESKPTQSVSHDLAQLASAEGSALEVAAVDLLKHCYQDADSTAKAIGAAEAWPRIVRVGSQHSAQESVVGPLLSVLEVMSTAPEPRAQMIQAGGHALVQQVLLATDPGTGSLRMKRLLSSCLANLAVDPGSRRATELPSAVKAISEMIQAAVAEGNSDELVVAALSEHLRALRNLAYDNSAHTGQMLEAGALKALQALTESPVLANAGEGQLGAQLMGVVLNLGLGRDDNCEQMAKGGVVARVCALLRQLLESNQPSGSETVAHGLNTLLVLSTEGSGRAALGQQHNQLWPLLLSALGSEHAASPAAARSVFAILGNMGTSSEHGAAALAQIPSAPEQLMTALQAHKESSEVQEAACGALRNLAAASWRSRLVELGAVQQLVELMAQHQDSPSVLQNAISALMSLAQSQDNIKVKGQARRFGAIPLIKAALEQHSQVDTLREVGVYMLRELGVKF